MGRCRFTQAGGHDALHQPRLLQRRERAVQVIQAYGKVVQLFQFRSGASRHGIGQHLLLLLRFLKFRCHVFHLAVQQGEGHLVLRFTPLGRKTPARLGQNVDQALVVIARASRPSEHLVELMHIQPLDAHS